MTLGVVLPVVLLERDPDRPGDDHDELGPH